MYVPGTAPSSDRDWAYVRRSWGCSGTPASTGNPASPPPGACAVTWNASTGTGWPPVFCTVKLAVTASPTAGEAGTTLIPTTSASWPGGGGQVSISGRIQSLARRMPGSCSMWMNLPLAALAGVEQHPATGTPFRNRPSVSVVPLREQAALPSGRASPGTVTSQRGWCLRTFCLRTDSRSVGAGGVVTPLVRCTSLPQVCWLIPWNCTWVHAPEPYHAARARVAAKNGCATLCAASDASNPRLAWQALGPPRVRRLPARRKLRLSVPLKTPIPWSWVVLSSRGCGTAMLSSRLAPG